MIDVSTAAVALLDANVLYPMPVCDFLLTLAEGRMLGARYNPRWSAEILEEVRRNLVADHRCTPAQAIRRITLMNEAFPEADVEGYEIIVPLLTNEPKDRHVLAAAIHARADFLVTFNVRDFPVNHFGVEVVTPDTFLMRVYADDWKYDFSAALSAMAQSLKRPQLRLEHILQALAPTLPQNIDRLRDAVQDQIRLQDVLDEHEGSR